MVPQPCGFEASAVMASINLLAPTVQGSNLRLDGNRTADRSLSEAIVDGTCITTITSLYRRAVFRLVNPLTKTEKSEVRACDRGSAIVAMLRAAPPSICRK